MGVAGYAHFLALAERAQWDETTLDLSADAALWPRLSPGERDALLELIAGFCVAETAVADELEPFIAAALPGAAACLRAQQRDERRHARFFARVAEEVVGASVAELRPLADPDWRELFELRLPAVARELGARPEGLADAVGLYHMVLEGVVLTTGLHALIDGPLPGVRAGAELIMRDERWHVGLGARCLQDAGLSPVAEAEILAAGVAAGGGGHVLDTLRRRLAVVR